MKTSSVSVVAARCRGVRTKHAGRRNVDGNVDRKTGVNERCVTSRVVDEKCLTHKNTEL